MGYQIPILREYVQTFNAEVHVVHWDHKKLTPYKPPKLNNVNYYNRSTFTYKKLREFVFLLKPDIVFICGWMDKGYLAAVISLRKKGIPVVNGIDDIWFKTFRQRIASVFFPLIRNMFFSHAWVTGPYQYEYARKLGFRNNEIVYNCYSADLEIYNNAYNDSFEAKREKYPHRFLYAGRLELLKGIDLLTNAWNNIKAEREDWELCIIGNGSLSNYIDSFPDIILLDFMQPERLVEEIAKAGCYILPSRFEPWALVLHEFSAAGLPIICSDICGAAPVFVISGYNGHLFTSESVKDLEQQMLRIIRSNDNELISMATNSHKAGQKITPEMSAASFMSILD